MARLLSHRRLTDPRERERIILRQRRGPEHPHLRIWHCRHRRNDRTPRPLTEYLRLIQQQTIRRTATRTRIAARLQLNRLLLKPRSESNKLTVNRIHPPS